MECAKLLALCIFLGTRVSAQEWPVPYTEEDAMPNIELSLAPAAYPSSDFSEAIASFEASQAAGTSEGMEKVNAAFNTALREVKARVASIIARELPNLDAGVGLRGVAGAPSFIQQSSAPGQRGLDIKVKVAEVQGQDAAAFKSSLASLQQQEMDSTVGQLHEAEGEFNTLSDFICDTLSSELRSNLRVLTLRPASALALLARPAQGHVKIASSNSVEATEDMQIQGLVDRTDVASDLFQERVIDLQLTFLKAANVMIAEQLSAITQRISANGER